MKEPHLKRAQSGYVAGVWVATSDDVPQLVTAVSSVMDVAT
jgi:hypothetical protein